MTTPNESLEPDEPQTESATDNPAQNFVGARFYNMLQFFVYPS